MVQFIPYKWIPWSLLNGEAVTACVVTCYSNSYCMYYQIGICEVCLFYKQFGGNGAKSFQETTNGCDLITSSGSLEKTELRSGREPSRGAVIEPEASSFSTVGPEVVVLFTLADTWTFNLRWERKVLTFLLTE